METPASLPPDKPQAQGMPAIGPVYSSIEELINSYRLRNPEMIVDEINPYTDPATGQPDLVTIRYRAHAAAGKSMIQVTPASSGGWVPKGYPGEKKIPLFNRIRIPKAERILVVEGEKCVRAVTELGIENLAAVTSCGGSNVARRADWSALAGKTVYVWADNDEPGRKYAAEVTSLLGDLQPPCKIFRVREEELLLPDHGDVVDYIADNPDNPVSALELVLFDAEPIGAAKSLADHLAKVAAGEYKLVEFANKPNLTNATQAYLPGTVTIIAGEPEAGKSFFLLEEAWRQHEAEIPIRILMMEDDHAFHLRRALAQMSGQADILDHRFTEENIAWAQDLFSQYKERLSSFGAVMEAAGSLKRSLDQIADWIEASAKAGARLIFVDPITAGTKSNSPWNDDLNFMMRVKQIAEDYGCSIILVTHPKQGKPGAPGMSGLSGGAAYSRFAQTVVWLKKYPEMQYERVSTGYTTKQVDFLRSVHAYKARNGRDGDKKTSRAIAVSLNPENLCFTELGMLI